MRFLASAIVSLALLLCVSCADRHASTPLVGPPRSEVDDRLLNLDRELLNSVRLDFAFEGTFEEAVNNLLRKSGGPWVVLPTPYPEQTWRTARVKLAVTDAGLYDILAELGRQAGATGPVMLRNDRGMPMRMVTYVRPLLSAEEVARLPEHAVAAVRKEMNRLAELDRLSIAGVAEEEWDIPVGPEYRYTAILCARPPALVQMILKEMDRGGNQEKGHGAWFLKELFSDDYRAYMHLQLVQVVIEPEPPLTTGEIEEARKEAVAYLSELLASKRTGTVALRAESALEALRDEPEPAESD